MTRTPANRTANHAGRAATTTSVVAPASTRATSARAGKTNPALRPAKRRWPIIVLLAATLLSMGGVVTHEFLDWDDQVTLWANPRMNPPSLQSIAWYWGHQEYALYIPVTYSIWGWLAGVGYLKSGDERGIQLNPEVFHGASLLVHMLSAIMVFLLLRELLEMMRKRDWSWAACAGALLFALHPFQVETVAWASGFKDLLYGFFSLLALWLYVLFVRRRSEQALAEAGGAGGTGGDACKTSGVPVEECGSPLLNYERVRFASPTHALADIGLYVLATLVTAMAMLSKPTAMVIPALAFTIDYFLLGRRLKQIVPWVAPWFVLSAVCMVIAHDVQPAIVLNPLPAWTRPYIAGFSLAFYLRKLLAPLGMTLDYGWYPNLIMEQWWAYSVWLVPVVLAAVLFWKRRRYPWLWTGYALMSLGVAPVLGLVPFRFQYYSTVADHYMYLAMLGPALVLAWGVARFGTGRIVNGAVVGALVVFGSLSFYNMRFWRKEEPLYTHAIAVNPDGLVGSNNLAVALAQHAQNVAADMGKAAAMPYYEKACTLMDHVTRLRPEYVLTRRTYSRILSEMGRFDEAIVQLERLLYYNPRMPPGIQLDQVEENYTLARALINLKKYKLAEQHLENVLKLDPKHRFAEDARLKLAWVRQQMAAAAATQPARPRFVGHAIPGLRPPPAPALTTQPAAPMMGSSAPTTQR